MMTSSIKEAFWSSIQKRSLKVLWRSLISFVSMSRVLSISDSNWTWNSLQKEHHIAYAVEIKQGGSLKNDVSTMGGLEMMTHDDRGEGGQKLPKWR